MRRLNELIDSFIEQFLDRMSLNSNILSKFKGKRQRKEHRVGRWVMREWLGLRGEKEETHRKGHWHDPLRSDFPLLKWT